MKDKRGLSRRTLMNLGLATGAAALTRRAWGSSCPPGFIDQSPFDIALATTGAGVGGEAFPTSPFILNPFTDPLPIPQALQPGYRQTDGTLTPGATNSWTVRSSAFGSNVVMTPQSTPGYQDAMGKRGRSTTDPTTGKTYVLPDAGTHQLWPGQSGTVVSKYPQPILYHIRLQVREAQFTTSPVVPIDNNGNIISLPAGVTAAAYGSGYLLPRSTIYGFNGTFPGPMINIEYGKPVNVRFENDLDLNPYCLDRQDFGAPDWAFLTHLHNGHTAPESDGQPHHMTDNEGGYQPAQWCDNLYLGYPAGGDDAEKQSYLWFHDHRMHHTGPNVYKGMVGIAPHYDPILDPGDETARFNKGSKALGLPGRRVNNADGSFNVKYDIPLALYDCVLDDGVTPHQDYHNGQGELHPEWWGKTFHRHYPNHGFVGDIFTVNGTAYPVMNVYRRKYRLRFLDCSVSRIYQLWLMRGTPVPAPATRGQWQIPNGQQCMKFTQIAAEGGLLPSPIVRNSFEIWPAKRREFVVDFTKYLDGSPTQPGDVIYLVNSAQMDTGRLPNNFPPDPNFVPKQGDYMVPMIKIVIGGAPPETDYSIVPSVLRPNPVLPKLSGLPTRQFTLERSSLGPDTQWVINGLQFDPLNPLALPKQGNPELWTVANGGGGWVHPMHMHMEEHRVLSRNGKPAPDANHPDDTGREDVVALYPSESVQFYRNFRTFKGKYVAHCHNLAHEDHNMMFGWAIV
jgi:FtsP/CotA-like multicopper oxidase with cupredoxin domain